MTDDRTGPPERRIAFDLVTAKMNELKADTARRLNADIFRDDGRRYPPAPRVRWWTRWAWAVRGYFHTLWLALRGVDPYEPGDDY